MTSVNSARNKKIISASSARDKNKMLKGNKTKLQSNPSGTEQARYALCALILLLSIAACYNLSLRLISQLHFHRAKNLFIKGSFSPAADELQKADHYQPGDYRVKRGLAKVYYKLGISEKRVKGALSHTRKAQDFALQAARLNPLDAESAYELALAKARLEQLYPYTLSADKENNPYRALPYFQDTLRLRPNGVRYHYAFTRYLVRNHSDKELLPAVRTLARIYPPIYSNLKKEAFWSPPLKEAVRQGLEQAIDIGISAKEAHKTLSYLWAQEGKWAEAIHHYQEAIMIKPLNKTENTYFQLGRLHLQNRNLQAAKTSFLKGLALSPNREKQLESLYHVFKNTSYTEEFYDLYKEANQLFSLSAGTSILLARTLMDLKQYYQARRILEDLNAKELSAPACYWLARIAEKEKNWDRMELAIQKATVLEPANIRYRRLFLSVLKRLKKYESVEKELELIIQYSDKPSAGLYSEKAQIKWIKKDYPGAIKDWQTAIRLKPDNAGFYARTAEAWIILGKWSLAVENYQKAVKLDPDNRNYKKRLLELQSEGA